MKTNYQNIPAELKSIKAWCLWRYADVGGKKPTKVPYQVTGELCDVTSPETWNTFDVVLAVLYASNKYNGIGFVFSSDNNYSFIDLDHTDDEVAFERQTKIYKEFDSYSEISPSGKGLHIIVKGIVPAGRRRSFIEIYSSSRYAAFTGNVYNDKPIEERQSLLTQLWEQMGGEINNKLIHEGNEKEEFNDQQIIEQALNAANGEKFKILLSGNWQTGNYPSQSEADLAFVNIVAFYTQNRKQIERIFKASPLGNRKKATRKDYLTWMINKSFDKLLPKVDIEGFRNAVEDKVAHKQQKATKEVMQTDRAIARTKNSDTTPPLHEVVGEGDKQHTNGLDHQPLDLAHSLTVKPVPHKNFDPGSNPGGPTNKPQTQIPPGLMGELAQFIYAAAPRPVPEIALTAAIGLMAGICGKAYNVSSTGLNQYILLISPTGTGKESMASGISKLMNAIKMMVPTSGGFIGPAQIASGQALIKYLNRNSQCFVSILGEFGLRLQSMSAQYASSSEIKLKEILLDLFNKSGHGQIFHPSIYSDKDKNIDATYAPSFSILGESTPERFYTVLSEEMISEGLLPRFMIVEYDGDRVRTNKQHEHTFPSRDLVERLATLAANCETIMHAKKVINVGYDPQALAMLEDFDRYCDDYINNKVRTNELLRQLWSRAHMKSLKLSALVAVGVNPFEPIITAANVVWAIDMVQTDIIALSSKFERGEVGESTSEIKQDVEIIRLINEYINRSWREVQSYAKDAQHLHAAKIIPYNYLYSRANKLSAFKRDRLGATQAVKRTLQALADSGKLIEVSKDREFIKKYGTGQRAFMPHPKILD